MTSVHADLLREIVSQYDVLDLLGKGGMGTVYRVRHRHLNEVRVAKIMRNNLGKDHRADERFRREAQLLSGLHHPNIARIFEFFVNDEGEAAILMEWVPGEDLLHIRRRLGAFPLPVVLAIGHQTLLALEHLHERQYIHRDISPDNLMLCWSDDTGPTVKMIDLGIAKALDDTSGMTATGSFLGKVRYSSPERLSAEGTVDPRSDLYSLGVVLYELLTDQCPIRGDSPGAWITGHLFQHPKPFEETDPEGRVPAEVRETLLHMLAKKAEDRPASTGELLVRWAELRAAYPLDVEALATWADQLEIPSAEAPEEETLFIPGTEASPRGGDGGPTTLLDLPVGPGTGAKPSRGIARGIALALLILAALAFWWWSRDAGTPTPGASLGPPAEGTPVPDATRDGEPDVPEDLNEPAQGVPAQGVPAQGVPAQGLPAQGVPAQSVPARPAPERGRILLDAVPWAEVASIAGSDGTAVPLPADSHTPLAVDLLPGRYRIEWIHSDLGRKSAVTVTVGPGETVKRETTFEQADADALLQSMGW